MKLQLVSKEQAIRLRDIGFHIDLALKLLENEISENNKSN